MAEIDGGKFSEGALYAGGSAALSIGLQKAYNELSKPTQTRSGEAEARQTSETSLLSKMLDVLSVNQEEKPQLDQMWDNRVDIASNDHFAPPGFRQASEGDPMQKILPKNYKPQGINNLPGQGIDIKSTANVPKWQAASAVVLRFLDSLLKIFRLMLIIYPTNMDPSGRYQQPADNVI